MTTFLHWTGIVALIGAAWCALAIGVVILKRRAQDNLKAQRYARARLAKPEQPVPYQLTGKADTELDITPPAWASTRRRIPILLPPRIRHESCGCVWFAGGWYSPCLDHDERMRDAWTQWEQELSDS